MKTPTKTTAIATDGLRFTKKEAGSPYGPGIGLTLSCIRCGIHQPRTQLKPIRVAGKVHYCCELDCRPGAVEKRALAAGSTSVPAKSATLTRKSAAKPSAKPPKVQSWRDQPWADKVPYELAVSLDNFQQDDKSAPSLAVAVEEAGYVVGLHSEGGTESHAMLSGERGEDAQKEARKTVKDCRAFIRRHKNAVAAV